MAHPPAAARPPSVDALARSIVDVGLPHPLLVEAARDAIAAGAPDSARGRADAVRRLLLQPVINATGVLLHTNLGRAPVEVYEPATYSNVELDLATGNRGSRQDPGHLLALATGAERAMVVNNGAAAVLLVLAALASGRAVVVSRGELVEIGGGFRIPEVLAASRAGLVEVGTTNRTRLGDFEAAATERDAALILKVHPSNYRIVGFTESVGVADLSRLGVPVVYDIGSGLLDEATPWLHEGPPPWLAGEPAARQSLEAGAALVTFSGDKLFGGPQAGVIAGSADLVDRCARHPLARALRPGALVLEAMQRTALAYLGRAGLTIPFWRMATAPLDGLRGRAEAIAAAVGAAADVVESASIAGAGSLPGREIPSFAVAVDRDCTESLRRSEPPIVARTRDGSTFCDLRTVDPTDDDRLAKALAAC